MCLYMLAWITKWQPDKMMLAFMFFDEFEAWVQTVACLDMLQEQIKVKQETSANFSMDFFT